MLKVLDDNFFSDCFEIVKPDFFFKVMISTLSITLPTFSTLSIKQLYRPRPEPLLWMYFLLLSFTFWAKFSVCCIYFHWEELETHLFYVVWLSKGHRQIEGKGEQNKLHKSNNHPKIKLITKNATIFPSFEGQMGNFLSNLQVWFWS